MHQSFHEDVEALAAAMRALLDDMGKEGTSVCLATKAQARIAYESFAEAVENNAIMPIEEARRILRSLETLETVRAAR